MWQMEAKFNLKWGIRYWEVTKDGNLMAFFVNPNEAEEYFKTKTKEEANGQVSNSTVGGEEVRGT